MLKTGWKEFSGRCSWGIVHRAQGEAFASSRSICRIVDMDGTALALGDGQHSNQIVVRAGSPPPKPKKKIIKLLNRTPSPVILEDYGELEPTRCTIGGHGVAGGVVGIPTQVTVTARDAAGVHIREGGQKFVLHFQHMSKGSVSKSYESIDHGDGHYTFTGVRADLKGMHQLSVEVSGSLVGDSPYLVMFEVDDGAIIPPDDDDVAASIKQRIIFVQHMNPTITSEQVLDTFEPYGKITKCERLVPAKDVWMIQFARAEDASEAATMNARTVMNCQIDVAVATHLGGVGTHPVILQQLQQIQMLQMQEHQSLTWAQQLAQQRASIRQAGGQVEELTDTRKKRKAVALMQRLQAKVAQAQQAEHLASAADNVVTQNNGTGANQADDLRNHVATVHDSRVREREKERSHERERERNSKREKERSRARESLEREVERRRRREGEAHNERSRSERDRHGRRDSLEREDERRRRREHDYYPERARHRDDRYYGREVEREAGNSHRDDCRDSHRDRDSRSARSRSHRDERREGERSHYEDRYRTYDRDKEGSRHDSDKRAREKCREHRSSESRHDRIRDRKREEKRSRGSGDRRRDDRGKKENREKPRASEIVVESEKNTEIAERSARQVTNGIGDKYAASSKDKSEERGLQEVADNDTNAQSPAIEVAL